MTALRRILARLEVEAAEHHPGASMVALVDAEVGLAALAGLYPKQLSGGGKKRVEIARSLAVGADVIIADEPFSGIDSIARWVVATAFGTRAARVAATIRTFAGPARSTGRS